ncbi:MAG: PAS domain S-box-containing protein [Colwellia sp.]|jgi:PAS domain S-box-containing protein
MDVNMDNTTDLKVLIVDDEATIVEELSEYIESLGFDVTSTITSLDVCDMLINDPAINIVIADLKMPKLDGFSLIERIKNTVPTADELSILIISGNYDIKDALQAVHLGVSDFLPKPLSIDLLHHSLKRIVENLHLRKLEKEFVIQLEASLQIANIAQDLANKANKELASQNEEKDKRAEELIFANKEKEKRADELVLANKEKAKRADELALANKELAFQKQLDGYRSEMERVAQDLTLLIDTANAPIFGIDAKGNINEWNKKSAEITGFDAEEVWGKNLVEEFISLDYRESVNGVLQKALKGDNTSNFEFPLYTKRNNLIRVLLNATTRRNTNGDVVGVVGVGQDITELKQAGEEKELLMIKLQLSQKMEALGKLTGGVAHEYNNMLGIIIGFAGLLKDSLVEQPQLMKYVCEIQHAGERGAKLTQKLLAFSQQKTPDAQSVNLNLLLQSLHHMLEKILTMRINIVLKLQEEPWLVWLDEGDMEDVILNLSINAMHAIEGNGQLTIQTQNQKINQMDAESLHISPGDYVLLSVIDTGCGIDKETIDKIFDPFFTTKGPLGTGLGLSIVYGFVQNSGGVIKAYSEPEEATQFTLYFPRYYEKSSAPKLENDNNAKKDFKGNKTILVVDDEPALLDLISEILSLDGFKVICAESAIDALKILEHESVDIMISDVIMPEFNGYQLAVMVKEKYPDIKIQLASGFNDDQNYIGAIDENLQRNSLQKPFKVDALLQRIRELCDEN